MDVASGLSVSLKYTKKKLIVFVWEKIGERRKRDIEYVRKSQVEKGCIYLYLNKKKNI
jgi:hypothetical protein